MKSMLYSIYFCSLLALFGCKDKEPSTTPHLSDPQIKEDQKRKVPKNGSGSGPGDFGMSPQDAAFAVEALSQFLAEGTYYGHLEDGTPCQIEVSPIREPYKDLSISIWVASSESQFEPQLKFLIDPSLPIAIVEAHETQLRYNMISLTQKKKIKGPVYLETLLSLGLNNSVVDSVYIFEEEKMDKGLSNAKCML